MSQNTGQSGFIDGNGTKTNIDQGGSPGLCSLSQKAIVLLVGRRSSGKTSAANTIKNGLTLLNRSMDEIPLAEQVKKTVAVMYGWSFDMLDGRTPESRVWRSQPDPIWSEILQKPVIPLEILVTFGSTLVRDNISPIFWLGHVHKTIGQKGSANVITIPDCRFNNEINYFIQRCPNLIICSITSSRTKAPYEPLLREFLSRNGDGARPTLAKVEEYLESCGVFKEYPTERAEWQTVLQQMTNFAYLDKYISEVGHDQRLIHIDNDGTRVEFDRAVNCYVVPQILKVLLRQDKTIVQEQ